MSNLKKSYNYVCVNHSFACNTQTPALFKNIYFVYTIFHINRTFIKLFNVEVKVLKGKTFIYCNLNSLWLCISNSRCTNSTPRVHSPFPKVSSVLLHFFCFCLSCTWLSIRNTAGNSSNQACPFTRTIFRLVERNITLGGQNFHCLLKHASKAARQRYCYSNIARLEMGVQSGKKKKIRTNEN